MSCPRHESSCAYTGTELDRCPFCHTTWAAVESCVCQACGRSRAHHVAWHEQADAARARAAARRAERRVGARP